MTKPNFRPRKYLSWSQLNLWETDPEKYIAQYIYGQPFEPTPAMALGGKVATALDRQDAQGDPVLEHIITFMQSSQFREFPIRVECEGVPLYGKLDGYTEADPLIIDEVKTGKLWTQKKVDTFGQLTFYGLMVYLRFKVPPEKHRYRLHWAATEGKGEDVALTGQIETFETKRTMRDLLTMVARVQTAWKEINETATEAGRRAGLV